MLTERQGKILASIVSEYTKTAIPVSSSHLVKKYFPDFSTATIRNEMLELERQKYLLKPHISAGRVPSDKGYRFFVDHFLRYNELKKKEQEKLQVEMLKLKAQNTRLSRTLAKMLSTSSHCLGLSGVMENEEYYDFGLHTLLKDPEFEKLDEISKISASLDLIDQNVDVILKKIEGDETKIFIGRENPIKEIQQCSMIVSPYRLESGEKGILAIIGPKRMKYEKNKSLIDFVKRLLRNKGAMVAIVTVGGLGICVIC